MSKGQQENIERTLVEGCVNNDRLSQEMLFRKYFPAMMRMCLRYTSDREEAMDIVNTGFLRVFKKIHTFSFTGSLEGWIRKLVFHALSDYFKKQKNKIRTGLEVLEKDAPIEESALSNLYFEDIVKLVEKLPAATKKVFWSYAVEGFSHAEISEAYGISIGTSKWHLSMARQKLQELLKKHFNNSKYHAG